MAFISTDDHQKQMVNAAIIQKDMRENALKKQETEFHLASLKTQDDYRGIIAISIIAAFAIALLVGILIGHYLIPYNYIQIT